MNNASIPVKDYKALASQFNPTSFNAHDIVALAKAAGMKAVWFRPAAGENLKQADMTAASWAEVVSLFQPSR